MLKGRKTVSMETFVANVVPYTSWTPFEVKTFAMDKVNQDMDALFIIKDIEFTVPKEDVIQYYKRNSANPEVVAMEIDEFEDIPDYEEAAPEPKRRPGRPPKAKEPTGFDPEPEG